MANIIKFNTNDEEIKKMMIYVAVLLKRNGVNVVNSHEELEKIMFKLMNKYNFDIVMAYKYSYFDDKNLNMLLMLSEGELLKMVDDITKNSRFSTATPKELGEFMIKTLNPKNNCVLVDLFSGEGCIEDSLFQIQPNMEVDGIEYSEKAFIISQLKKAINNYSVNYKREDILRTKLPKNHYDYCVADMPFYNEKSILNNNDDNTDKRIKRKTSFTWQMALKILDLLNKNGRAVFTTLDSCLYNTLDKEARQFLIDNNYIESIVSLPAGIFSHTGVKTSLIVLNKNKSDNKVNFVDLSEFFIKNGNKTILDISRALENKDEYSMLTDYNELSDNDYSLNIKTYTNKIEVDFPEKLGDITLEIFRGYSFTTTNMNQMIVDNPKESTHKLLEIGNINEEGKILNHFKYIKCEGEELERYVIRNNDILLSARGSNTKICLVKLSENEKIVVNGSIVVIRANENLINPVFLKMFFDSEKGRKILESVIVGISIPALNIKELKKIQVSCPDMNYQNELVDKYILKKEIIDSTSNRLEQLKDELKLIINEI